MKFGSFLVSGSVATCLATLAGLVSPFLATATPATETTSVVLSRQTVDNTDYIVSEITIGPGGSTGWHTHRGSIYGVVKTGTLTHFSADCHVDGVYTAGDPITDPTGLDHIHLARNMGSTPVILEVTYVDPAGAPMSDSAADPGCGIG